MIFTPTRRQLRLFNVALDVTKTSPGVGGRTRLNFRIGCVIANGYEIVSVGTNSYRTSPRLVKYYKYPFFHAEARAVFSLPTLVKGCDIYIARIHRNDEPAVAKPCYECQKLLDDVGIRNIYYTTEDSFEQL